MTFLRRFIQFVIAAAVRYAVVWIVMALVFSLIPAILWLAMPRLINGQQASAWALTAVFVGLGLATVFIINRIQQRLNGNSAESHEGWSRETTELHTWAQQGLLARLQETLQTAGMNESRDNQGYTPLMVAVTSQRAGVGAVHCLIEHGANVNAISAPQQLIEQEHLDTPQTADVETEVLEALQCPSHGYSVLSLAAESAPLVKIQTLIEHGADTNWIDHNGYSVLLRALYRTVDTTDEDCQQIIDCLIESGAPLDAVSRYGESVLSVSSQRADVELLQRFLDHGADATVLDWNELFLAVAFGTEDELQALLESDAAGNQTDCWGRTPFLWAVHCGRVKMAQRLAEHGCDTSAVACQERTAIALAIEGDHGPVLKWLLDIGCDVQEPVHRMGTSPLRSAVEYDHPGCVRLLIDAGADL
ncbi:MAG: ankyrin repeat domain-containing protein, partial [Planctomycetaceae bacterium]